MDHEFSIPELRILMAAVQSASFITEKKTEEFFEKISALAGKNHAEQLNRERKAFNVTKHTNENVYYNTVTVSSSFLGRLFHFGTLEIVAAGTRTTYKGTTVGDKFAYMKNAEGFRNKVTEAIAAKK